MHIRLPTRQICTQDTARFNSAWCSAAVKDMTSNLTACFIRQCRNKPEGKGEFCFIHQKDRDEFRRVPLYLGGGGPDPSRIEVPPVVQRLSNLHFRLQNGHLFTLPEEMVEFWQLPRETQRTRKVWRIPVSNFAISEYAPERKEGVAWDLWFKTAAIATAWFGVTDIASFWKGTKLTPRGNESLRMLGISVDGEDDSFGLKIPSDFLNQMRLLVDENELVRPVPGQNDAVTWLKGLASLRHRDANLLMKTLKRLGFDIL